MSEYIFKLPDLGEGTVESEIGEWFIKVGDNVKEEDVVGTMMTDKAAVELSAPVSGKVLKLAGEPGPFRESFSLIDCEGCRRSSGIAIVTSSPASRMRRAASFAPSSRSLSTTSPMAQSV